MNKDLVNILKLLTIICAIVLLFLEAPHWIVRAKMAKINREWRARCKEYEINGIPNVTRGGHRTDTLRIDTLNRRTSQ